MDISLSILSGLGLRLFLFTKVPPGPLSNKLTAAILGLCEGVMVHQLSARATSSSASLDHILAFGLRLAVDLLLSRDAQRMMMILLWSSLSTVAAELVAPHESLRPKKLSSAPAKERRHRQSRSVPNVPNDVPIIQPPLPPRIRAYRPPSDPILPAEPPQMSSTPLFSQDPPTPPSFFLHETNASASPSPKHVLLRSLASPSEEPFSPEPQIDALPVRPPSGLATTLEGKADLSPSPLPVPPVLLPTPPTTAEGAPPSVSDAPRDNLPSRFELYTILEQSSPEDGITPHGSGVSRDETPTPASTIPGQGDDSDTIPLPVPAPLAALPHNLHVRRRSSGNAHVDNWLATQDTHAVPTTDASAIFTTPFSPGLSPAAPIPVRLRSLYPEFNNLGNIRQTDIDNIKDDVGSPGNVLDTGIVDVPTPADPVEKVQDPQSDSPEEQDFENDELRTPVYRLGGRQPIETDIDDDSDPLRTPKYLRPLTPQELGDSAGPLEEVGQLSPLGLDVRSALAADEDNGFAFDSNPAAGSSRRAKPSSSSSIPIVAGAVYIPTAAVPVGSLTNFFCADEVRGGDKAYDFGEGNVAMPGSLEDNSLLKPPSQAQVIDNVPESSNNAATAENSTLLAPVPATTTKSKGKGKGKAKAKTTSIFTSAPVAASQPALPPPPAALTVIVPPPKAHSPAPPSPSTILSEGSDLSVFSSKAPPRLWLRADALRREARDLESRRAVVDEQRRRAEVAGRALEAIQLRTELREIDRQVERLHEKAARRYYVARNSLPSPTKIDVHGLRPREAQERIDRAIVQAYKDGKQTVTIIVGKGLHSVNQQPTLKPLVQREMQRLKLPCIVNPRNEGQLIITLVPPTSGRV